MPLSEPTDGLGFVINLDSVLEEERAQGRSTLWGAFLTRIRKRAGYAQLLGKPHPWIMDVPKLSIRDFALRIVIAPILDRLANPGSYWANRTVPAAPEAAPVVEEYQPSQRELAAILPRRAPAESGLARAVRETGSAAELFSRILAEREAAFWGGGAT